VIVVGPETARRRVTVAGDLGRVARDRRGHDQFVAVEAAPDALLDEFVRDRVVDRLDRDRGGPSRRSGLAERSVERLPGHRVQLEPFLGKQLGRDPAGLAVNGGRSSPREVLAGILQFWDTGVLGSKVHRGGDQVRLRDPDRRLRPALRGRIGRHARPVGMAGFEAAVRLC
jgi:hypothetical protein